MRRQMRHGMLWGAALVLCGPHLALAGTPGVGPAAEVAPRVEATRQQRWPRAAWAAEAKCWLVAWREGDITDGDSDIWCGRVSADGRALDPAGVRVTKAKGVQDRPVVASDGKGFLVAWSDLRNGKDWDVYAARVSAEGKVLDADGLLVAGGAHSQCQPAAAFAAGNYLVAWQSFVENALKTKADYGKFGSYEIRGSRVSASGRALDAGGKRLVAATAVQPALAADGNGGAWLAWVGRTRNDVPKHGMNNLPGVARMDAAGLAPQGSPGYLAVEKSTTDDESEVPCVVCTKDGGGLLTFRGYRGGNIVFRFGKDGRKVGEGLKIHIYKHENVVVAASLAAGGGRILLTQDWPKPVKRGEPLRLGVWGWILLPDGKVLEGGKDGFAIAVDPAKDQIQGFACAGPEGAFLVVYAEPRGPDDTKVLARLVKSK